MGRDSELQARKPDRVNIGLSQVLLTEMDKFAPLLDGQLPVVVDNQQAVMVPADLAGRPDFRTNLRFCPVLDAQLHQPDPKRNQACNPVGTVQDQIKRIESHSNTAMPITGVEGFAMSRGSSGWA